MEMAILILFYFNFIFITLLVCSIKEYNRLETENEKLKLQFNDEDEAMNWLEAASSVSDKAKFLLEDVKKCKQLPEIKPKNISDTMLENIINESDEAVRLILVFNFVRSGRSGEHDFFKVYGGFRNNYCKLMVDRMFYCFKEVNAELSGKNVSEELSYINDQMAKHSINQTIALIGPRLVTGG